MNNAVMPFSGGMDSSVMLKMMLDQHDKIYLITFDYGQRHKKEIECALIQIDHAKLCCVSRGQSHTKINHKVIDVSFLKDISPTSSLTNNEIDNPHVRDMIGEAQPVSYVPFRNQLFLTIACAYAESVGANTVYHGATQVDSLAGYWDGSPEFEQSINNLISLNRQHSIKIKCPLINMDKKDIIRTGISNGVDFRSTYTCYSGEDVADATTPSSSLRIKGFAEAGYIDPQPYKQDLSHIWEENNCKKYPEEIYRDVHGTRGSHIYQ